jgi:hypothetical protein
MQRVYHVSLVLLSACVFAGCGLYSDGPPSDSPDAGPDATPDVKDEPAPPVPCKAAKGACANAVPAGWLLTAFDDKRVVACPANFAALDLVANPMAGANPCACGCMVTTQPSCATGMVTFKSGPANNNCTNVGNTYTVGNNLCVTLMNAGNLSAHFGITMKAPLVPGACTATPMPDNGKLTVTPMRSCAPPPTCEEDVCLGNVPAGTRGCILHDGDVACPGAPFTEKVAVVGNDATLGCTCGTCTNSATCGDASIAFYDDANCTNLKDTLIGDGACHDTNQSYVSHFIYAAATQNVMCSAPVTGPAPDLISKRTVCCRL